MFGVYTANQNNTKANLSALELENLEILAEGEPNSSGGPYYPYSSSPVVLQETTTKYTNTQGGSNTQTHSTNNSVGGNVGFSIGGQGGKVDVDRDKSKGTTETSNSSYQTETTEVKKTYCYPCIGSSGAQCQDRMLSM